MQRQEILGSPVMTVFGRPLYGSISKTLSSNYCSDRFPTGSPIVHVLTDDELDAVRLVEVPEKFFLSKVPYLACIILRYGRISVIHADRSLIHTLSMLSIDDFEDLFG